MTREQELPPHNSFQAVSERLFRPGIAHQDWTLDHVQAVLNDAFKERAVQETIYDSKGHPVVHESLCHPVDQEGREYPIAKIADNFYDRGMAIEFDTLTCSLGIKKAAAEDGQTPITLNISVESALSPEFFEGIHQRISDYGLKPQDIIFEILEHDVDRNADISHLREMKELGYGFALDDFGKCQAHRNRLHVFSDIIDFIKVDGPFVRAYLEDGFTEQDNEGNAVQYRSDDILKILDIIQTHYNKREISPVPIVAEHVREKDEVKTLEAMGFSGFQSRHLGPEKFAIVPLEELAKQAVEWDHS